MSPTLESQVVLIAGGAKNLGGLLSREVAARGADVVVHYNSDASADAARETVAAVEAAGRQAIAVQGDLKRPANVQALFDAAIDRFGKVDVAVNTVGKVLKKPIVETTEAEYDEMFAINAKAAYFFLQESGKRIEDGGRIVTIVTSLLAAFTGLYSTYAGSKSPVEHFARAAAKELAPRGISVTALGPGPMDTPFFYPAEDDDSIAYHRSQSLNGELTKIEDITPIIEFLVTGGWWITGQTIFANGGYTTR
ncbi:SDR family oxidoreductase [Patulibacter brassicae]|uniref:SDR family oxidoreductase n=1 Tax=Patulibacter brassicae TaxID=1705717 RepID=A0ABU4VHM6_9ACTN|nr:SDR family oxidoreductase [Patulibacter brassicae]MDX8151303.1 SDR family oxidoreductase [Patulibacter brassicae]